jgi:hypothetical protein
MPDEFIRLERCRFNLSQSGWIAKPGSPRAVPPLAGVSGAEAPVIHPTGKPALQKRIHLAAFEPIPRSAAISRLALIERAPRFSITISRQINQKPL